MTSAGAVQTDAKDNKDVQKPKAQADTTAEEVGVQNGRLQNV